MKMSYLKKSFIIIAKLISITLQSNNASASLTEFPISPYLLMSEKAQLYLKFETLPKNDFKIEFETFINDDKTNQFSLDINKNKSLYQVPIQNIECGSNFKLTLKMKQKDEKNVLIDSKEFPTLPCDEFKTLNFVFISDTQNTTGHLNGISKIIRKINSETPLHFIIHGGDFVRTGGSQRMWKNYFSMRKDHSDIPLIPVIGNHEYYEDFQEKPLSSNYKKYMSNSSNSAKGYSLLSLPHFNLIRLNSNFDRQNPKEQEEQLNWLRKVLAESKENNKKIIVSFHHSPFTSVTSPSNYHVKRLRNQFVPLFEEYSENVLLVLTGHNHLYERSIKNNVHYLVSGPAGGIRALPFRKNPYSVFKKPLRSTFTYFSIKNKVLDLRTYDRKAQLIDSLTFNL
ncbi:MAG: metallophosphoesterase [Bdellovibrionota bacterium]|nr:metallophosphoesterase [Bdellovibrionota bacterium]